MACKVLGTYEDVASEYYDAHRHPTCANFREASCSLLDQWLRTFSFGSGWVCEVGAGKSLLAELLAARGRSLSRVVLIDSSPGMLAYSKRWCALGASLALATVEMLPLVSESVELLVASVGDPYNEVAFWKEVRRVLQPRGVSLFTTPSYEWASAFRIAAANGLRKADFELSDGRCIQVPSLIYPEVVQIELFEQSRLVVSEIAQVPRAALRSTRVSPKLLVSQDANAPVISGYVVTKR